jgi:hypothetical protein
MLQRAMIHLKATIGEEPTSWYPIGDTEFVLRTGAVPEVGILIVFVYAGRDVDASIDQIEQDGSLLVSEIGAGRATANS